MFKDALDVYNHIKKKDLKPIKFKLFNTIHATKGAEADVIFMFYNKGKVNEMINANKISKEEENNVLYVGSTRAKKGMFFVEG